MKTTLGSLLILTLCGCGRNETGVSAATPTTTTAEPMSAPPPTPASGETLPLDSPAIAHASSARLTRVLIGYQVGELPRSQRESRSREDAFRHLIELNKYAFEHPDPIIAFSKTESDYDDFCVAERAAGRQYYVYAPEEEMYYVCVANKHGKWVYVPSSVPTTSPHGYSIKLPRFFQVVGRTHFVPDLKPGERREIYLER